MFGYVTINAETLTDGEKARFRRVYCGVCSELSRLGGAKGRLTLSYDSAFLALLLNALYEPEEETRFVGCTVHPIKKREQNTSEMTRYAADVNIMLFYYSLLDGWIDDKNLIKKAVSDTLKKCYDEVSARRPEKNEAIIRELRELSRLEKARAADLDAAAACFGRLLGEVFVYRQDEWAPTLRRMGDAMGRFIYICDAWEDADKDRKRGAYNPLLALKNEPDYEDQVFSILQMEMASCADAFERLPIVTDINILRNVIYSGIWTKYSQKRKVSEKEAEDE